jgi:hypothetical protein
MDSSYISKEKLSELYIIWDDKNVSFYQTLLFPQQREKGDPNDGFYEQGVLTLRQVQGNAQDRHQKLWYTRKYMIFSV